MGCRNAACDDGVGGVLTLFLQPLLHVLWGIHLAFKIHRTATSRFKLRISISVVSIEDSFAECLDMTIFIKNNR